MTAQQSDQLIALPVQGISRNLPPLILHPFAQATGPNKLVESSRASLIIQGLLPAGQASPDQLQKTLLEGRYSELCMLFYVGKDVQRWIDQCMDAVGRTEGRAPAGITAQSFASLLIQHTPPEVVEKLKKWSVNDFKAIFSRGLGLNSMFADVPARAGLSDEFVRSYFRYADQLFFAWQSTAVYTQLNPAQYRFDLYSSGEYSKILEQQWS